MGLEAKNPSLGIQKAAGQTLSHVCYLHGSAGGSADERRGPHGRGRRQAPLPLLLVDSVALCLRQLQEVLHGAQVDQQRLGCSFRVLLLAQDLRQQTLHDGGVGGRQEEHKAQTGSRSSVGIFGWKVHRGDTVSSEADKRQPLNRVHIPTMTQRSLIIPSLLSKFSPLSPPPLLELAAFIRLLCGL